MKSTIQPFISEGLQKFTRAIRQIEAIQVVAGCLILQILISFELWVPFNREFPMVPAFNLLPVNWGFHGDAILVCGTLLSLVVITFRPKSKRAAGIFLILSGLLILEDLARLQPWLYLFGLLLFMNLSLEKNTASGFRYKLIRLVLAGIYFWSGFQKFNLAFGKEVLPWLAEPLGLSDFFAQNPYCFIFPALFEFLAGIFLLFSRTARTGAIMAGCMHLLLLFVLGPLGQNWNLVVLPWNLALIVLLFLVVERNPEGNNQSGLLEVVWHLRKNPVLGLLIMLIWVMPAFNFCGFWDSNLSGSLYSGNNPEAAFYYREQDRKRLPESTAGHLFFYPETTEEFIVLDSWFMTETNTPLYPEIRYFKAVGGKLCNCLTDRKNAGIRITIREKFTSRQRLLDFQCEQLRPKEAVK